jgi:hypothetical protein
LYSLFCKYIPPSFRQNAKHKPSPALIAWLIELIFLLVTTSELPHPTLDKTLEKVTKGCCREFTSLEILRIG